MTFLRKMDFDMMSTNNVHDDWRMNTNLFCCKITHEFIWDTHIEDAGSDINVAIFYTFFSVKNAPKNDTFGTKETTDITNHIKEQGLVGTTYLILNTGTPVLYFY
jgi:hypothetical protein